MRESSPYSFLIWHANLTIKIRSACIDVSFTVKDKRVISSSSNLYNIVTDHSFDKLRPALIFNIALP